MDKNTIRKKEADVKTDNHIWIIENKIRQCWKKKKRMEILWELLYAA